MPDIATKSSPLQFRPGRIAAAAGLAATLVATTAATSATAAPAPRNGSSSISSPALKAGWTLRFRDDFSGAAVDKGSWSVFNGPGNNHGPRTGQNVIVRDGILTLRTRQIGGVWTGAGMSGAKATTQTYGKYKIRARFDKGHGVRTTALLWPKVGFPPEVDFYEIEADDGDRNVNLLTNHFKPGNQMQHERVKGEYSDWHIVGVEWTPNKLVFTMDGAVTATMTKHIPAQPMWFGMVTGVGLSRKHAPNASTPKLVDFQVDWVEVYQYTP